MAGAQDHTKQRLILVLDRATLEADLANAGLAGGRPVVILIGGAAKLDQPASVDLRALVRDGVIAAADAMGAAVIDGGTDSGVMALAGRAHNELATTVPLIGVAPVGRILAEEVARAAGTTRLEPNHSHVVLTPGNEWGAEVPWLMDAARIMSRGHAVVAVVIDGGAIAAAEVEEVLAQGWPVIALAGSGRTADDLARSEGRPQVVVLDVRVGGPKLAETLRSMLGSSVSAQP